MDELASKLQSILSTPQGQEQLKNIQAMLGMSPGEPPRSDAPAGGPDFSGLLGALGNLGNLGNLGGGNPGGQAVPPTGSAPGVDLSGLASMLAGLTGGTTPAGGNAPAAETAPTDGNASADGNASTGGVDLSGLASILGGLAGAGPAGAGGSPGFPSIDMGTILKLQKAFQSMNVNDKNSQLLLSLKPHLGERRGHRVDQAIRMMRLFAMLPALRESGIFAGL